MRFSKLALWASMAVSMVKAIDTIEIRDRHFYNSKTGEPFFIKGVDYQPGGSAAVKKGSDPLSDPEKCARDIFLFQKLGINTIRVYSVDPAIDHNECMTMLAAAGIYLVLDVNSPLPNEHLHDLEPWTTYTPMYLKHVFEVIEVFSGYDNLLAFLSGNEVVHNPGSEKVSPRYVKAVTRDMKAYISNHIHRVIPVGYSNADHVEFRVSLSEYLSCGKVGYIDFFAINSYQWCGENTFKGSGYDILVRDYSNYSLPIFFSEYGCNKVRPRLFQETAALFSEQMTGVFSGGLIYEFTQEDADYGIVQIAANGKDATILSEFDTLQKVHESVPNPKLPDNVQVNKRPECQDPDHYPNIVGDSNLPATLGADYIKNGVASAGNVKWTKGKFISISDVLTQTSYTIKDSSKKEITNKKINFISDVTQAPIPEGGHGLDTGGGTGESASGNNTSGNGDDGSDAISIQVALGTVFASAMAAVFATL
ncbi:Glucanosyltransferase-domain-containing protein [Kalaharituber pfeilii]|nr:Glucanosyltransferase-domain-containing protein [Kalaharituber pfeilii]